MHKFLHQTVFSAAEHRLLKFAFEGGTSTESENQKTENNEKTADEKKVAEGMQKRMNNAESARAEKITTALTKAMIGLEGGQPDFKEKFEKALASTELKNMKIEIKGITRAGASVILKDASGKTVATFLADHDGNAKFVKVEQSADTNEKPIDWKQFKADEVKAGDILLIDGKGPDKHTVITKLEKGYRLSGAGRIREFDNVQDIKDYFKSSNIYEVTAEDAKKVGTDK